MARTDYYRHTNGTDTLYALPITSGAWSATGKIDGDDSAQSSLYVFAALVDGTDYEIFIQVGGAPAEGDVALGVLPAGGGSLYGSGGVEWNDLTVTVGGIPQDGVAVWVTLDEAGTDVKAGTVYTNVNGQLDSPFMLEPLPNGQVYYLWLQKAGKNFTNPTEIAVTTPE